VRPTNQTDQKFTPETEADTKPPASSKRLLNADEAAFLAGRSRTYFYRKIAPHLPFDGEKGEDRRWWEKDVIAFLWKRRRPVGGKRMARRHRYASPSTPSRPPTSGRAT
jgi:predicted DNA-binding transcriptional regulator AlpA